MTQPPPPKPTRSAPPTTPAVTTSRHDRIFWISVGLGALLIGYGVLLLFRDPVQTVPFATSRRFAVILLLHDMVLLPLVFGFAIAALHFVPPPWRAPMRFALFVSAMVLLVAAWGLAGQAIEVQPGNKHVLPNHYPTSVALLLTPVWLFAVAWGLRAQHRNPPHRVPAAQNSKER